MLLTSMFLKMIIEREVIITVKLEYTDSRKEEVKTIICLYNNDKFIRINLDKR